MTTDEEAKAYDMALEAARKELGVDRKEWKVVQQVLHNIFPELRESEDERIREEIVDYFKKERECLLNDFRDKEDEKRLSFYNKALAWLEKQKEQKPQGVYVDCTEHPEWYGMPPKEQKPADLPAGFYVTLPDGKKYYTKEMRCKGMNIKVVEPKPIEWSKEDEEIANTILNLLCSQVTYVTGQGTTSGKQFPTYPKERDWFEKRFKSLRPQPKVELSEDVKKNT